MAEKKYWSKEVTERSGAREIGDDVFTQKEPRKIALALKKGAESNARRKEHPYQSAMSMLNFYINRAGSNLPQGQKKILDQTKDELRKLFLRRQKGTGLSR